MTDFYNAQKNLFKNRSGNLGDIICGSITSTSLALTTQPYGFASGLGSQTTAANTNTDLINTIWSSVTTVNMTWTATSGRFTITQAGYYLINVNVGITAGPAGYIGLNMYVNAVVESTDISEMYYYAGNLSINRFKYLAVGDTIKTQVYAAFGGATFGGDTPSHFIVFKLF